MLNFLFVWVELLLKKHSLAGQAPFSNYLSPHLSPRCLSILASLPGFGLGERELMFGCLLEWSVRSICFLLDLGLGGSPPGGDLPGNESNRRKQSWEMETSFWTYHWTCWPSLHFMKHIWDFSFKWVDNLKKDFAQVNLNCHSCHL